MSAGASVGAGQGAGGADDSYGLMAGVKRTSISDDQAVQATNDDATSCKR